MTNGIKTPNCFFGFRPLLCNLSFATSIFIVWRARSLSASLTTNESYSSGVESDSYIVILFPSSNFFFVVVGLIPTNRLFFSANLGFLESSIVEHLITCGKPRNRLNLVPTPIKISSVTYSQLDNFSYSD